MGKKKKADCVCLDFIGYGRYYVSKKGNVYSTAKNEWKMLKPDVHKDGHLFVILYAPGIKRLQISVHKLVMISFIGKCPKNMEIRHLNGISSDNRLSNLRYGTRSQNAKDSVKHGTCHLIGQIYARGENNFNAKLTKEKVVEIRKLYETGKYTHRSLAIKFGVTKGSIGPILNGKAWFYI